MLAKLQHELDQLERKLRTSFGTDTSTPKARRWTMFHYHFFDQAFLREIWTNFAQIAPDVYRSNQPTWRRFKTYKAKGIKTILNLRGASKFSQYLFEKEFCDTLGLTLVDHAFHARRAPEARQIIDVIATLRELQKPFLLHCKSGADRAGFISAIYLLVIEGSPVQEARKQLSWTYSHLDFTKTGVLDYILNVYEARLGVSQIDFEEWLASEYDAKKIQTGFDQRIDWALTSQSMISA